MNRDLYVTFIGIDGSGKTSSCKKLLNELRSRRIKCVHVHHKYSFLVSLIKNTKNMFHKKIYKENHVETRKADNILDLFSKTFLFLVILVDAVLAHWNFKVKDCFSRNNIILFDRYYCDLMMQYSNIYSPLAMKLFYFIMPKADITFYFDVSPRLAFKRKKEAEVNVYDNLRKNQLLFLKKVNYKNLVMINANKPQIQVDKIVLNQVLKFINKNSSKIRTFTSL